MSSIFNCSSQEEMDVILFQKQMNEINETLDNLGDWSSKNFHKLEDVAIRIKGLQLICQARLSLNHPVYNQKVPQQQQALRAAAKKQKRRFTTRAHAECGQLMVKVKKAVEMPFSADNLLSDLYSCKREVVHLLLIASHSGRSSPSTGYENTT